MAYDSFSLEYDLTPKGWICRNPEQKPDPAPDRVETWRLESYQQSMHSREENTWSRTWKDPDKTEAEIVKLRCEFKHPDRFPMELRSKSARRG